MKGEHVHLIGIGHEGTIVPPVRDGSVRNPVVYSICHAISLRYAIFDPLGDSFRYALGYAVSHHVSNAEPDA